MISEYEIVPKGEVTIEEYEEITVQEFLDRENASPEEIIKFCNTYNAVNIHFMICEETYEKAFEVMNDKLTDPRLEKLNAIVLLSLKPKGRAIRSAYTRLSQEKFKALVDFAFEHKIGVGFDSCGCGKFVEAIHGRENEKELTQLAEPCESGLFSSYFNTEGKFFPCSFAEGNEELGWVDGVDVINSNEPLWKNPRVVKWRKQLLACHRSCPMYKI